MCRLNLQLDKLYVAPQPATWQALCGASTCNIHNSAVTLSTNQLQFPLPCEGLFSILVSYITSFEVKMKTDSKITQLN